MKSNTEDAFRAKAVDRAWGAGRDVLGMFKAAAAGGGKPKFHLVGHSAGSIWHAYMLEQWAAHFGAPIDNLILFAPAATHALFQSHVALRIKSEEVAAFTHFLLGDQAEQDDTVAVYAKSLLYLVSRSFEQKNKVVPIVGMERYRKELPRTPNTTTYIAGQDKECTADKHGAFDNDLPTMNTMLRIVLGAKPKEEFTKEDLE
jgi:pimeloyl-ACP methyl ester carboxylesterase